MPVDEVILRSMTLRQHAAALRQQSERLRSELKELRTQRRMIKRLPEVAAQIELDDAISNLLSP